MQNSLAFLITLVFGFDMTCGQNVKCGVKLQQHLAVNTTGRFALSLLLLVLTQLSLCPLRHRFFDIFHDIPKNLC